MGDEVVYMLGVVGVGFLVNYALRALPFLLFAGRRGELPAWVSRFGNLISPIIIAALIVYSYSGLAWRTPWPYVAGALTVGLQLWGRNPLASIVAGTLVYMLLLSCCGCATPQTIDLGMEDSALRVTTRGILLKETPVQPADVVEALDDYDVPRDRAVYILLDPDVKDLRPARQLMASLARAGYTRSVLVTKRHGESYATGRKKSASSSSASTAKKTERPALRYKKANE